MVPLTSGLGTANQAEPFQCRVSPELGLFCAPKTPPTAQQSEPVRHVALSNAYRWPAGGLGPLTMDHEAPFQDSSSGPKLPFWKFVLVRPTAQQSKAFTHEAASGRLSEVEPVLGLVMMLHAAGRAGAGCGGGAGAGGGAARQGHEEGPAEHPDSDQESAGAAGIRGD